MHKRAVVKLAVMYGTLAKGQRIIKTNKGLFMWQKVTIMKKELFIQKIAQRSRCSRALLVKLLKISKRLENMVIITKSTRNIELCGG